MPRSLRNFTVLIFIMMISLFTFACATSGEAGAEAAGLPGDGGTEGPADPPENTESRTEAASDHGESHGLSAAEPSGSGIAAAAPVIEKSESSGEKRYKAADSDVVSESEGFGTRAGTDEPEEFFSMMVEEAESEVSSGSSGYRHDVPGQSGLKAGYSDDNRQYGYFLRFLEEYGEFITPLDLDVSERITLSVTDSDGKPVHGAEVYIAEYGQEPVGRTHADGTWQFNPPAGSPEDNYTIMVTHGDTIPAAVKTVEIDRFGPRSVEVKFDSKRAVPEPIPLDIVFVMDTTGSMGEEIERLKNTIQLIHLNLTSLSIPAEVRFGMVLYKDIRDEYRTKTIPLTGDLYHFQVELDKVSAFGGGDTPEDLEAALNELMNTMEWNPKAIQLAYIITDAPPHLDYYPEYTCADAARDARIQGLKIYGIGTGGLDLQGEYILRQIAQYTSARYIFLTYGSETGESSGGTAGSVSHHTGSNWNADKLESIIIRFAREEISYLTDRPLVDEDPWFEAGKIDTEEVEETLASLFDQAIVQLFDYSTFPVGLSAPLAVLPFRYDGDLGATSEYFNEHFILSAGRSERISLAERKEISQILEELEFQNTGLTDEGSVGKIGEFLNAEILVSGNLFMKSGKYELFLKLLRTETGEVLSVTRAVIDPELGL